MQNEINNNEKYYERWIPFILYAIIAIIYSLRFFKRGEMIFGHDFVLTSQYLEAFAYKMLQQGDFPFWNPYMYSGVPHFSALNGQVFYPTYFLYPLFNLPPHINFMIEYILCIFMSGCFMYLFAKNIGLSKISSFLTGIFFMFSGSLIILINAGHLLNIQAMTYIPLIFYFFNKGIQKNRIFYFLLAGCFLSIQCFSTGFQIMAYTVVMLFMYIIVQIIFCDRSFKVIGYFLLTVIVVPFIAAVQFIPAYYYNKLSYRAVPTYEYFVSWSYPPAETIDFLLPRFYGFMESTYWGYLPFRITSEYFGILPIVLAFISVFFLIKDKRVLCFTILSSITLLLAYGGYTPIYRILYHFPVISSFRNPARWIYFFSFSVILLSGFGIDFLLDYAVQKYKKENFKQYNKLKIVLITLTTCLSGIWIWFTLNKTMIIAKMRTWKLITGRFSYQSIPSIVDISYKMIAGDLLRLVIIFAISVIIILSAFRIKFNKHIFAGCLLILFLADMWYVSGKAVKTVPITKPDIRQEETINFLKQDNSLYRVLPIDGFSSENWFMSAKIQSVKGYTISLKDYHDAMNIGVFNNINFLNLLNVKYLLTTRQIEHPLFKLVFDRNIKIYQNLGTMPRASLFNKVEVIKNKEYYMNKIMSPNFNIREKLIINEDFDEKLDVVPFNGDEIDITAFHPNYITLDVNNPGNSVLFMSEIYYPEWKVKVDGKETKIYKADGLFRAVYLTKGNHHIKFYYSPKLLYIGSIISFVTILSLIILIIREKNKISL